MTIGELKKKLSDMSSTWSEMEPDLDNLPIFMWADKGICTKVVLLELLITPQEGDPSRIIGLALAEAPSTGGV